MACKNKKVKTKYPCIYSLENSNGSTSHYALIKRNGTQYGSRNMTKLFGCNTAKQAHDKVLEIHQIIDRGEDPFSIRSSKLDDLFYAYNSTRNEPYKTTSKSQYNKWVKELIGYKKIDKIQLSDIENIMNTVDKAGNKSSTKIAIKDLLQPIFKEQYEKQNLSRNILNSLKIKAPRTKVVLNSTLEGMKESAKDVFKVMKEVPLNDGNSRLLFLLSVMTARRIGELEKLEYSDIDFQKKTIKPRPETTKTKKDDNHFYNYPIPIEAVELLDPNGVGRIFTYHQGTYTKEYKKRITDSKIEDEAGFQITSHTNRHFFQSIMSQHFDKDFVGEVVLSHKSNNMNLTYMTYTEEKILELYEAYWEILRG
ncbi:MAG: site-specific integrase [Sulfuricurvum sp.]|nr:site-specific integrase [Sulfuricurvum sp.]